MFNLGSLSNELLIKGFLKFTIPVSELLSLIKLQGESLQHYWKKTPAQVFSCEFCEIFRNIYFEEHLWMASFVLTKRRRKLNWISDTELLANAVSPKSLAALSNLICSEFLFKFLFFTGQKEFPDMNYTQFKLIRVRDGNPLR